jgi:hypothetical protein
LQEIVKAAECSSIELAAIVPGYGGEGQGLRESLHGPGFIDLDRCIPTCRPGLAVFKYRFGAKYEQNSQSNGSEQENTQSFLHGGFHSIVLRSGQYTESRRAGQNAG